MDRKTVMFIDDDEAFLLFIRRACSKIENISSVLQASDGLEAINKIMTERSSHGNIPNVIFVDVNMPRMDGFGFLEALQKLKDVYPELVSVKPVVMLTSSDQQRDRDRAISLGADIYTVKTPSLKETRRLISEVI